MKRGGGGLVDVYTTTTWVLCNETGGGGLVDVYTTTTWVLCNETGGGGWWRCIPQLPGFYVMKQGGGLVDVYTTTTWVLCNETGGGGAGGRVYHNYLGFM